MVMKMIGKKKLEPAMMNNVTMVKTNYKTMVKIDDKTMTKINDMTLVKKILDNGQ